MGLGRIKWALLLVFYSSYGYSATHEEAFNKAKEAAYIQSGAAASVSNLQHYAEDKAHTVAVSLGVANEIGASFFIYKTYKERKLKIKLGEEHLIVEPSSLSLEIPI